MGKYIPISAVSIRKNNLSIGLSNRHTMYPLYGSYRESYNFSNIRDALYYWNTYSDNLGTCIDKLLELYDIVLDKGSKEQILESSNIINSKVVSYLKSPVILKKDIQKRINESESDDIKQYLYLILEQINQEVECDRLLSNYNSIMKRFNIDKIITNGLLYEENLTDTIYSLCELIDTYDMDLKSKMCITAESALYSIDKTIDTDITLESICENIIDYYMINYGKSDIDKYLEEVRDVISKDSFIHESVLDYVNYLEEVRKRTLLEEEDILFKVRDTSNYGYNEECNNIDLMMNDLKALSELAIIDKAKEVISKIKMLPAITANSIKEGIRTLLVPFRVQDMKKGTANALSLAFYVSITAGSLTIGAIPGVLALISSIFLAKDSQKRYIKDALQEWKEHKYSVNRKLRDTTDPEKKRKIEAYLDEVDKNIELLENEYEKTRDKSTNELDNEVDRKINSPFYNHDSNIVSPSGKVHDYLLDNNSKNNNTKQNTTSNTDDMSSSVNDELAEYEAYMRERKGGK